MGKIMILNGSPRASVSNSKRYADIFMKCCRGGVEYFSVSKNNHNDLCGEMEQFSDVLLVFPLYTDAVPVTLLNFLKTLEMDQPHRKPVISVLINCGFMEPMQNDIAVKMIELFCRQNGYKFGSVLKIGSGEAILSTPFKIFAILKIKKLANSISVQKYESMEVTMPITKRMFIKASTAYWLRYGAKNGCTKEEMDTMMIESRTM